MDTDDLLCSRTVLKHILFRNDHLFNRGTDSNRSKGTSVFSVLYNLVLLIPCSFDFAFDNELYQFVFVYLLQIVVIFNDIDRLTHLINTLHKRFGTLHPKYAKIHIFLSSFNSFSLAIIITKKVEVTRRLKKKKSI